MLFFADLDNDNAEGLIDEADNSEASKARLFFVPAGVDPVEVSPPRALRNVLGGLPVRAIAHLTFPTTYEVTQRLGLSEAQARSYEELTPASLGPAGVVFRLARPLGAWRLVGGSGSPDRAAPSCFFRSPPTAPSVSSFSTLA